METTRSAMAVWHGDLTSGEGTVTGATRLFTDLPISWAARTEEPAGMTSPEELLAAAHAACFSMACSSGLAKAGHPPERLEVTAEVAFTKDDSGWSVSRSTITVRGKVPGIDEAGFRAAAEEAKDGCPISRALKGNVELAVEATLES